MNEWLGTYVWQSCVEIEGYSSPHSKCRIAEHPFFVSLHVHGYFSTVAAAFSTFRSFVLLSMQFVGPLFSFIRRLASIFLFLC